MSIAEHRGFSRWCCVALCLISASATWAHDADDPVASSSSSTWGVAEEVAEEVAEQIPEMEPAAWRGEGPAARLLGGGRFSSRDLTLATLVEAHHRALLAWTGGERNVAGRWADAEQRVLDALHGQPVDAEFALAQPTLFDGSKRLEGVSCLLAVQSVAAAEIGRQDPEALLPLAFWALEVHLDERVVTPRPWIALHAQRRAMDLLEEYRRRSDRPDADETWRLALLGVIDTYYRSGSRPLAAAAAELSDEVRRLDRHDLVALYWRAFLDEKLSRTDLALRRLSRMLEQTEIATHPLAPELRLRSGKLLARGGKEKRGLELLEQVARDPQAADWLRIVAFQEWSQVLALDGGASKRSVSLAVLREALEAYPEDPRLRIMLAHGSALHGPEPSPEIQRVLAGPASDMDDEDAPTPRLRYEMPDESVVLPPVEELRHRLAERMPALRMAVERLSTTRWEVEAAASCDDLRSVRDLR